MAEATDTPAAPPPTVPLRIAVGVAAAVSVLGWVRAMWGVAGGEISLPILYGVTALAAGVAAVRSRSLKALAVTVALVCVVAVADRADPGIRRPPAATGTLSDPEGVLWMRLPVGWTEDSNARVQKDGYFIRKWVPVHADPTTVPQLEIQMLRTSNRSWDRLKQTPGVVEEQTIARGPAEGVAWRIEHAGEGQTGIELHHGGRRIFVRFKARLGQSVSGQGFEQLRPEMEAILDSVRFVAPGWFGTLDRTLFGG